MRNNAVIPVTVGEAENNDFRVFAPTPKTPSARILSLVIDKNGAWSKEGDAQTVVKKAGTTTGGTSSSGGGTTSGSGNNPPPPAGTAVFSEDFSLPLTISSAVLQNFILIADNHGASYRGNESLGFCLDRFDEPQLYEKWKKGSGSWNIVGGQLQQSDEANWNGNISLPLTQKKGGSYMYSVRFKLSSKGENRRFGLHLFATDANTANKGDSYLIWFRLNDAQPNSDFVEIHRSVNNELKTGVKQPFDLQAETWYHARVVVETATGIVTVWVNGQKVTSWKDTHPAIYTGNFISLRTGTASVWVDNLAVYQQASNPQLISIGNAPTKMIRHENKNGKPGGQIFFIDRDKSDKWINESMREVHVKFK
jgi:hypothetical protein